MTYLLIAIIVLLVAIAVSCSLAAYVLWQLLQNVRGVNLHHIGSELRERRVQAGPKKKVYGVL